MRIYYSDEFVLPLPAQHRFPMEKYRRLREAVEAHPALSGARLLVPDAVTDEDLVRVHDPGYVSRVVRGALTPAEIRRIGFPWSPELVERSRRSAGGTLGAAHGALLDGTGVNLAGGTHHAFTDRGEGFCVFNDVAVAVQALRAGGRVRRVGVLDLDVHQGNGTAAIFRDDAAVHTASVHGASNFPFRKERSDLDLPLPDGTGDGAFLDAVALAIRRTREHDPELVFYVAGADPFAGDRLGRLSVSSAALAERDRLVMGELVGRGIPVAVVMAGGYAEPLRALVAIHLRTVLAAAERGMPSSPGRPPDPGSGGSGGSGPGAPGPVSG